MTVRYEVQGAVAVVTIARPHVRNAVDGATAHALAEAFRRFDADAGASVAVLTGAGGTFCAGADLKAIAASDGNRMTPGGDGPMGPTRMELSKPVIGAIEGYAVAGGLELALWCDLRIAASDATLGVFNRRFGVPLVDLGTIRLPRIVGHARALDLILTGRGVGSAEALEMGLVNRVVEPGKALEASISLANQLAAFPQASIRADRLSALRQWGMSTSAAVKAEYEGGVGVIGSGESVAGAQRFADGVGRHGAFSPDRE
jgi:enoyl-CoA hydratase